MREIKLTQGKSALVDDELYLILSQYKWYFHSTGYAFTSFPGKNAPKLRMHHAVMGRLPFHITDHINGNRIDNRRENLRYVTHKYNQYNKGRQSNNTSGFKGVYWNKQTGKWKARITYGGVEVHLGTFDNAIDGARAYNKAAKQYHGEYARFNTIPD